MLGEVEKIHCRPIDAPIWCGEWWTLLVMAVIDGKKYAYSFNYLEEPDGETIEAFRRVAQEKMEKLK